MKDNNNLFAAVTVFRELYDNDKDIYDVIAEFIISAISYQKKWSFNSTEITGILEDTFDFNIPEAVVKTAIRKRLLKKNVLKSESGLYSVVDKNIIDEKDITNQIEVNQINYKNILAKLYEFSGISLGKTLTNSEKDEIANNFHSYITDNGVIEKYSSIISSFIIRNQSNELFKEKLNAIKEGLILYNGIRYTGDLNELGTWNSDLIIFLDTEHLFNAVGLNGVLYKQIFDDFYNLVKEVNRKNKSKDQSAKIELKYFPENKIEIDRFFYVAEGIVQGKATLDPSKTAMLEILNGCRYPSDIINKKTKFYNDLKKKGIFCDTKDYIINPKYNVKDSGVIDSLKKISEEKKKILNEDECYHFLNLFTKINILRHGISNKGFEKIRAILMSGNSVAHFMAHNKNVKFNETDIPFATDIDYITNKFWFKLRKGLSNKNSVPKSFDIVTKAQVVLSTQINESVSVKYSKMTSDFKSGKVTKEETISYHNELRSKVRKPEEIIPEVIDDSLSFLNDSGFDTYIREKSILEQKAQKGEQAIQELYEIKKHERRAKINRISHSMRKKIRFNIIALHFLIFLILTLIICGVYLLISPQDTWITIISLILMVSFEAVAYIKIFKRIVNRMKWEKIEKFKKQIRKV